MYKIRTEVEWDYAHRLIATDGEFYSKNHCGSNHGHRGKAVITLCSIGVDKFGFVIDFGIIRKIIKNWIDNNWDHSTLVNPKDYDLIEFLTNQGDRHFIMPDGYTTSAESMAKFLYLKIRELIEFDHGASLKEVTVYETPTSSATYSE